MKDQYQNGSFNDIENAFKHFHLYSDFCPIIGEEINI